MTIRVNSWELFRIGIDGMLRFIAFRILQFPLILAIIYVVTFVLIWVAPGDPFQRTERPLPPQVAQSLRRQYHAESWYGFLVYYPIRMVQGDFGPSFSGDGRSVDSRIRETLPVSMKVGLLAILMAVIAGTILGTTAAVHRGGMSDWLSLTVALIGVSTPSFVVAAVLRAAFTFRWAVFPIGSHEPPFEELILPALALSLLPMAYITRLTRASMIDVLSSDFIRTARAKGLGRARVIFKHGLRNGILPVISYVGPAAAAAVTGSLVVETAFGLPGMGKFFVSSITERDLTMVLGIVMVYSTLLLALNLVADVAYTIADPRISLD